MSEAYEAASEVCGSLESIRQELDYIGKQLDNSNHGDRRERIATAALQGILANQSWNKLALEMAGINEAHSFIAAAFISVKHADALMAELAKGEGQ